MQRHVLHDGDADAGRGGPAVVRALGERAGSASTSPPVIVSEPERISTPVVPEMDPPSMVSWPIWG